MGSGALSKLRILRSSGRSEAQGPRAAHDDVANAVEKLRERCARLHDVVAAECEPGGHGPCTAPLPCAGYSAIQDLLEVVADAEEHLISAMEQAVQDRNLMAQLAAATQGLSSIENTDSLAAAIPELALLVCPGAAAALLQVGKDGSVKALARCGAPFQAPQSRIDEEARAAVREGAPRIPEDCAHGAEGDKASRLFGRIVTIPLNHGAAGLALALERAGAGDRELEHLVVYGSLAGTAVARAHASAALREAAARDAAILGAIRDGVIAVDATGVVRTLNHAAAAALGVQREHVIGRTLDSVPGLGALGVALAKAPNDVMDVVSLPRGDVVLRTQVHEGVVVGTIRDVATEHTIAHRIVGSVARYTFEHMVGTAPAFRRVVEDAQRAARADVPILVCGESGTGKELLAQAIHNASPSASGPFIGINVTAIPRELLESELFGYEGGTFTGARSGGRAGKFELAGRGTLLLDEIGDMPLEMQGKLLRVLQERVIQRLGSARDIPVRARIIATTHRNLAEAVDAGRFRLDLFHRLCVLNLYLPPLRERREDVALLVEHQLRLHAERTGQKIRIAPAVLAALQAYHWPGNVRQLANLIEGEVSLLGPGDRELTRIPPALLESPKAVPVAPGPAEVVPLEELERRACIHALATFKGNVARAAQALGVAKGTLYSKMRRFGLGAPEALPPTPPREPEPRAAGGLLFDRS
jgi:sigma-54 dependent transcriptional regulator, acetoin dehydrogenase operon transcriptional activator AcoR